LILKDAAISLSSSCKENDLRGHVDKGKERQNEWRRNMETLRTLVSISERCVLFSTASPLALISFSQSSNSALICCLRSRNHAARLDLAFSLICIERGPSSTIPEIVTSTDAIPAPKEIFFGANGQDPSWLD
jgi:hypothetical protein